jgi:hypothetical protein
MGAASAGVGGSRGAVSARRAGLSFVLGCGQCQQHERSWVSVMRLGNLQAGMRFWQRFRRRLPVFVSTSFRALLSSRPLLSSRAQRGSWFLPAPPVSPLQADTQVPRCARDDKLFGLIPCGTTVHVVILPHVS